MRIAARHYQTQKWIHLRHENGRVSRLETADRPAPTDDVWVAPGFYDIQVNGYGGQEFSSPKLTPKGVEKIVTDHYRFGVTKICPTLTTQSFEVISHGLRTIAKTCEESPAARALIAGIHVEGPYFSKEDGPRGAHPVQHCRPPDWDEFQRFQEAAGGRIAILTMSPEYDNSAEFIAKVVASGVVVAIGHTGANSDQIRAAVDAGASLSTHLGNGAHRELRRHPNYIWDQLAEDRLLASLIVDGHHLPAEVVQSMVRAKTPQRCILVSDESGLAGLPPGEYPSSGGSVEILEDGRLVIAGQRQLLAGASRPLNVGIANVMRFAGVTLPEAMAMVTANPARLLNQKPNTLRPGDVADAVLFRLHDDAERPDGGCEIVATIAGGQCVHGALP